MSHDGNPVLPKRMAGKVKSTTPASSVAARNEITNPDSRFVEEMSLVLRQRGDVNAIIKAMATEDGMMSSALFSMVQIANSGYKLAAYDTVTGEMSSEGTVAAYRVVNAMDTLHDYTKGYNDKVPVSALIETQLRGAALTGGVGQELVLDEHFMPSRIQPVPYETLKWFSDGKGGRRPKQVGGSNGDIDLNIPNFFVAESHKDSSRAYAISLFRSALKQSFMYQEFLEDLRKSVKKSGHSRLVAKLLAEKVRAAAPTEIQSDPVKLRSWMDAAKKGVEDALAEIEPDDSVVSYDSVEFKVEDTGGSKADYAPLLKLLGNLQGTAMKTPSSVSGLRSEGSQSLSNAETLTYLKTAVAICNPVEQVMSRTLTLSARLLGFNVFVKFEFNDVDLRPASELEAYFAQRQARALELLSLGKITDVEADYMLGLRHNPSAPQLSGTNFRSPNGGANNDNPDRKDAMGKDLNPGTPAKAGGQSQ